MAAVHTSPYRGIFVGLGLVYAGFRAITFASLFAIAEDSYNFMEVAICL